MAFKINVGSKNIQKIESVSEVLNEYPDFSDSIITSVESKSNVSDQPKSMDETITGAINRAKGCFSDCDFSFGIESGLMKVPYTKSGYMDFTCCAIFDGKNISLGLSPALEFPTKATKMMFDEDTDITQALLKEGLTKNPKLGSAEGALGVLTKGRVTRKGYTKQAIYMAMVHLENPGLY
jgi:inosine/xanthosine triphosphatase